MTHIQIFKVNYRYVKFYGLFGLLLALVGLYYLINYLAVPASRESALELSLIILFILHGFIAAFLASQSLKNRRYFIEWDDRQIRYWQPKSKEPELISKNEVVSVEINKLDVIVKLKEGEKRFSLKHLYYPERKMIQEMFEALNPKD